MVLLASCQDEIELRMLIGLLEANNIEAYIDINSAVENTGGKSNLFAVHKVYVSVDNFSSANKIIEDSKQILEKEDPCKEKGKKRDKLGLRILLFLNFFLFGILAYYTSFTSEKIMCAALTGASIFFLLVFFFSFDWGKKTGISYNPPDKRKISS